jgi:hypothetical protein
VKTVHAVLGSPIVTAGLLVAISVGFGAGISGNGTVFAQTSGFTLCPEWKHSGGGSCPNELIGCNGWSRQYLNCHIECGGTWVEDEEEEGLGEWTVEPESCYCNDGSPIGSDCVDMTQH